MSNGAEFFRITVASRIRVFSLTNVPDFRTLANAGVKDAQLDWVESHDALMKARVHIVEGENRYIKPWTFAKLALPR